MELLLLKLSALARPVLSMRFGEDYFAVFGVGLFAVLVGIILVRAAVGQSLRISGIDALIVAFAAWCVARALIYYDGSYVSQLAKLLIPMLGYIVAKNIIPDRHEYRRLLAWIIVGFALPTLLSAALIAADNQGAVYWEMYQTGLTRWQGVYYGAHNFGHSMTLFLMTLVLYASLRPPSGDGSRLLPARLENVILAGLGATALYCLYMSQVRSAVLGLLVFLGLFGFLHSKKTLILAGAAVALIAVITAASWIPALLHEFAPNRRGGEPELMELGSGRPERWANDIALYARLPLDQQLAGVGVGVKEIADGDIVGGHSDWLRILWDTGAIGFALFAWLQILILRAILRLHGTERHLFLALFAAVNAMMLVSNSYTLRIHVSQLYFMMLAFIETPITTARSTAAHAEAARQYRAGSKYIGGTAYMPTDKEHNA